MALENSRHILPPQKCWMWMAQINAHCSRSKGHKGYHDSKYAQREEQRAERRTIERKERITTQLEGRTPPIGRCGKLLQSCDFCVKSLNHRGRHEGIGARQRARKKYQLNGGKCSAKGCNSKRMRHSTGLYNVYCSVHSTLRQTQIRARKTARLLKEEMTRELQTQN